MYRKILFVLEILYVSYFITCAVIKIDSEKITTPKPTNSTNKTVPGNDLVIGECHDSDKIIYFDDLNVQLKSDTTQINGIYEIFIDSPATITCVRIFDQILDGTGGIPTHHSGGPGERWVKIKIEGVPGHEIDFRFVVQGELKIYNVTGNEV